MPTCQSKPFDVAVGPQATLDVKGFQFQLVLKQMRGDQGWLKVMPWRLREFLGVSLGSYPRGSPKTMEKMVQFYIIL